MSAYQVKVDNFFPINNYMEALKLNVVDTGNDMVEQKQQEIANKEAAKETVKQVNVASTKSSYTKFIIIGGAAIAVLATVFVLKKKKII